MIGEFNRVITINTLSANQDAGGGLSVVDDDSYTMRAKVEDRNGFPVTTEGQHVWNYDYKITVRHERTRVIKSNQTISFDGKTLAINSVSFENEGKRRKVILRCSTTDNNILAAES